MLPVPMLADHVEAHAMIWQPHAVNRREQVLSPPVAAPPQHAPKYKQATNANKHAKSIRTGQKITKTKKDKRKEKKTLKVRVAAPVGSLSNIMGMEMSKYKRHQFALQFV